MPTTEQTLIKKILLSHNNDGRLFRNNTGRAWQGDIIAQTSDYITVQNYRPFRAGLCVGSSDIIGWTLNSDSALFTAIEVKTERAKVTKAQKNFINAVRSAGGIGMIVRSEDDYLKQLMWPDRDPL